MGVVQTTQEIIDASHRADWETRVHFWRLRNRDVLIRDGTGQSGWAIHQYCPDSSLKNWGMPLLGVGIAMLTALMLPNPLQSRLDFHKIRRDGSPPTRHPLQVCGLQTVSDYWPGRIRLPFLLGLGPSDKMSGFCGFMSVKLLRV